MTNEELIADYVLRMGDSLGRHVHRLEGEFNQNICDWREYRSLYGKEELRIALLNKAAPAFFFRAERIIRESVVLGIARVVDPRNDVISLRRLPKLIIGERARLKKSIDTNSLLKATVQKCQFALDWRNGHIAHRSEAVALNKTILLPPSSRQHVEDAHVAIGSLLNEVQLAFGGLSTIWNDVFEKGNAEVLLHLLSDGIRDRTRRHARFASGTYTQEDIRERHDLWTPDEDS